MNVSSVPAALVPRDELREGLGTLRSDALISHPVEKIQLNVSALASQQCSHALQAPVPC